MTIGELHVWLKETRLELRIKVLGGVFHAILKDCETRQCWAGEDIGLQDAIQDAIANKALGLSQRRFADGENSDGQ